MRIGAHESAQGGLPMALARAVKDGCRAVQVFTKNSNMWKDPDLDPEVVRAFAEQKKALAIPVLAHTSYLINLATDKPDLLDKSKDALVHEIERSSAFGIDFVVLHPGAHLGLGEDAGIRRVNEALSEVLERTVAATATVLIENTAGQGTCVGHRFEHVGAILEGTRGGERMGMCLDTQHTFAAGYDLSSENGYARVMHEIDRLVGCKRIRAFHLNDSKKPLGSRVDRHEHIGEGLLGAGPFWHLVNDERFRDTPAVLETEPREGEFPYAEEVRLLSSLVGAPAPKRAEATFALELAPPKVEKKKKR